MSITNIDNTNIVAERILTPPSELKKQLPMTKQAEQTVLQGRQAIRNILKGDDKRLIVVTGPCSIHDIKSAKEYATRLKALSDELSDTLLIVMRIYFEKPRTTVGWKGMINDPDLNGSFNVSAGLQQARELLLWMAELGLPVGTEALDPVTPQYLSDLFSWSAIGARTTESQTHREMASGLSTPVGFKNGTDGNLGVAINALHSVSAAHHFLGINQQGQVVQLQTRGNTCGHIILRGGKKSNYDSVSIVLGEKALADAGLPKNLMVDCSHGNSDKNPELQPLVANDVVQQILEGNSSIIGIMLESHLHKGNQSIPDDLNQLKYGVSVTDACIDWPTTEELLRNMAERLKPILSQRR
ncbi:MAG: 3-deoxy-7-phosphoheptulonate synthase [Gammaproteobacteria bacterium]|nr:MAG: 3-deoxy-7-phosphoheptulonate synthase [Gammaproteobacteria bacterium]